VRFLKSRTSMHRAGTRFVVLWLRHDTGWSVLPHHPLRWPMEQRSDRVCASCATLQHRQQWPCNGMAAGQAAAAQHQLN